MELIDTIRDAIQDFVDRTSRVTLAIITVLIVLIVSALIVLVAQPRSKKRRAATIPQATEFSQDDAFIAPHGISLTEDYYFSRVSEDNWSREETDRWFTQPSDTAINELGRANDALVDEILGAAP